MDQKQPGAVEYRQVTVCFVCSTLISHPLADTIPSPRRPMMALAVSFLHELVQRESIPILLLFLYESHQARRAEQKTEAHT